MNPSVTETAGWKPRIAETRHLLGTGRGEPDGLVRLVDTLVCALGRAAGWDASGRALVALGGYGRSEFAPWSDIDLLFLAKGSVAAEALNGVLYPLWDLGFDVGHALRTPRDCAAMARSDLSAATAFLDARLLIGDAQLLASARKKTGIIPGGSRETRSWVDQIAADVQQRRRRFGDVSGLLEPHVKEGRGGLRDFQALRWALRCRGVAPEEQGAHLPRSTELLAAVQQVSRVRNALHLVAGRKTDHLTFEHHRDLAALVLPEAPLDRLFEVLHRAGHTIAGACDRIIDDARKGLLTRQKRHPIPTSPAAASALAEAMISWSGSDGALPDAIRVSLRTGKAPPVADAIRAAAREILGRRTPLAPLLEELYRADLLDVICPELAATAHQVQYDARHAFTTGVHCIRTLGLLENLWLGGLEKEEPHLTRIAGNLLHPAAVRVAALCHDVGKKEEIQGHAETGAEVAAALARRLGLSREEILLAAHLVRHHHQMTDVAFGRDLEDPASWATIWEAAGDSAAVDALLCLAFADLQATNPRPRSGLWTDWKRDLLLTLHARTRSLERPGFSCQQELRRAVEQFTGRDLVQVWGQIPVREAGQVPPDLLAQLLEMGAEMGGARSRWRTFRRVQHVTEILGVAHTFPALLSTVTGCLSHLGYSILSFQVHTWADGVVHLWLRVTGPATADQPRAVAEVLSSSVAAGRPPEKASASCIRDPRREAVPVENRVRLLPDSHPRYSALEVRCRDRDGLMRDLAVAFEELQLTVEYALVTTHGPMARDVFHLKDIIGGPIAGTDKIGALLRKVEAVCRRGIEA